MRKGLGGTTSRRTRVGGPGYHPRELVGATDESVSGNYRNLRLDMFRCHVYVLNRKI
jgi:hypothetical protein